jgi:hypothetical protein
LEGDAEGEGVLHAIEAGVTVGRRGHVTHASVYRGASR